MITEEASAALRKANKWAQSGLIVSVGPPVETLAQETAGGITTGDKKKTAQTAVCRDRNAELARLVNKNNYSSAATSSDDFNCSVHFPWHVYICQVKGNINNF